MDHEHPLAHTGRSGISEGDVGGNQMGPSPEGIGNKGKFCSDNVGTPDLSKNGPMRTKRNKKGGGCNLRKSLAWNKAFFTEEGVLNPLELSTLSESLSKPRGNVLHWTGGEMSPLTAYNKCSDRPPLHDLEGNMFGKVGRNQTKDTKSSEFASSHEALQAHAASGKIPSAKGICKSVPRSPATNSQKRAANMNTMNSMSKIPKFMPSKSHAASPPMASRNVMLTTKSSNSNQSNATVNVHHSVGGFSSNLKKDFGYTSSTHEHEKNMILKDEKGTTSLKAVTDPSSSAKSHDASRKLDSLFPRSTRHVSGDIPAAAHAKPSALRMPSPSLGFFRQGKVSPSYGSQSQKNIQSFESSIPSIRRTLAKSTAKPPTKGTAATNSSAGDMASGSTKTLVKTNVEVKQLERMDSSNSINFESSHCPIKAQEELNSNCLLVGDTLGEQSGEVSLRNSDPDSNKEPYEDRSFPQSKNTSLVEESGFVNQFPETDVPLNIHDADQSTRDSNVSESSCANISSQRCFQRNQQGSNSKQLQEGIYGVDNRANHPLTENTGDGSYGGISVSAGIICCLPDLGSGLTAKIIEYGASTEAESFFELSKELVAGSGIVSSLEVDNSLTQEACITAQTGIACGANSNSGLSSTLSEESQSTLSEDRELPSCGLQSELNNNISPTEEENALMPEKKVLEEKLKPDMLLLKKKLNVLPFSDEWVASLQDFGEDILELKTGPVQNSPPDKALPEPGPWSPVKRKAQDVGPFDCTKYSKNLSTSNTQ